MRKSSVLLDLEGIFTIDSAYVNLVINFGWINYKITNFYFMYESKKVWNALYWSKCHRIGFIRMYNRKTRYLAIPMISYLVFNILLSIFKARYRLMIEPGLIDALVTASDEMAEVLS